MTPLRPRTALATHEVLNQPPERGDLDLWQNDPPLRAAVAHFGGGPQAGPLADYGAELGRADTRADGRLANRHTPELRLFDRAGRRLDEVEFHPAYHALLGKGIAAGYVWLPWSGAEGGHVAHAAMVYLTSQVDPGICCPMTMSYAAIPALRAASVSGADLAATWIPQLLSPDYDPRPRPVGEKRGATLGMAMTEKQGGSDVRQNTTRAERDGADYRLTGHKWFCSAPMCDGFLTLAQAPGGLTCFLVPRWTPDGARNGIQIVRLKDKLGNRSNASAEIEYHGAFARALGEEGEGVRNIIEMVHYTRIDTAMAPAGLMRAALSEALWWCSGRTAFQKRLVDQPMMAAVLADLAVEVEATLVVGLRVARAIDRGERGLSRIGVALAKYLGNKRCPTMIYEAMECLGGAGYVEEGPMPLLYREAPLNSIWEGSGNVICLDVLRALARDGAAAEALATELDAARGRDRHYDRCLEETRARWPGLPPEAEARWYTERLAQLFTAAALLDGGDPGIAEAYLATRLGGAGGRMVGAWPAELDSKLILDRVQPAVAS